MQVLVAMLRKDHRCRTASHVKARVSGRVTAESTKQRCLSNNPKDRCPHLGSDVRSRLVDLSRWMSELQFVAGCIYLDEEKKGDEPPKT